MFHPFDFLGIHAHTPILKDHSLSYRFTETKKSQKQGDVGFLLSCRVDLAYHLGGEFGESRLGLPGGKKQSHKIHVTGMFAYIYPLEA